MLLNDQFLGDDGSQCTISQMPGIPACVCTAMRLASDFQWIPASWAGRLGRNWLKQVVSESEFFSAVPWPEFWDTHTFLLFSFLSRNKPTEKYSHAIQVCYRTSSFGQQPSICFLPIQKRNRQMFQGPLEIMGEEGMQIESEIEQFEALEIFYSGCAFLHPSQKALLQG